MSYRSSSVPNFLLLTGIREAEVSFSVRLIEAFKDLKSFETL